MLFAPVNGQWRLFGISVSIGQMAPAAPAPPPESPVAQKQPAAKLAAKLAPATRLTPDNQQPK
jgi:hypothetical protein